MMNVTDKPRIIVQQNNLDAWVNAVSGAGTLGSDKTQHDRFAASAPLMPQVLSILYANDWLSRKICDRPAKDATRRGITIKSDNEKKLLAELERLKFKEKARDAIAWGRLYGGATLILLVDDGMESSEPLDPSKVRSLIDIMVVDRQYLAADGIDTDPLSIHYGMPSHFRLHGGALIHVSRMCRFNGASLTFDKRMENHGWGGSYIQLYWDATKSFQTSMQDLRYLMSESSLGILKVPGLTQRIAMGGTAMAAVMARAIAFNQSKSLYRTAIIDDEEGYEYVNRSLAGLADLLDRFMTTVSGATELPQLVLFGTTPGGLNASQEEQMDSYNDTISSMQEGELTSAYNKTLSCLTGGTEVDWEFKPLVQLSDSKLASVRLTEAQAVAAIIDAAGLTPDAVVRHLNNTGHFDFEVEADRETIPDEVTL